MFAILFIGFTVWLFTDHDPLQLVLGVLGIAPFLPAGALISGVAFGNVSPRGDLVIGQFYATRPATTSQLAASIVRASAASLFMAWLVWALALAAAWATAVALSGQPLASSDLSEIHPRLVLAAVVGSWIILGTMISVSLTGRSKGIVQILLIAMLVFIGIMLGSKFMLSSSAQQQLYQVLAVFTGVACLVLTIATFTAAFRRGLIELATAWAALAAWAILVIAAPLLLRQDFGLPAYTFTFGLLSFAVIPFAAAPLSLAWNRHR